MAKIFNVLIAAAALGLMLIGCRSDAGDPKPEPDDPYTATGTAIGFNGGPITVTITLDDTYTNIVNVVITGPDESPGYGSRAVAQMPEQIKSANSVDIDGVSGATGSSTTIKAAARKAYDTLMSRKQHVKL
jgi:fumarate reductase flavoprotein subunit